MVPVLPALPSLRCGHRSSVCSPGVAKFVRRREKHKSARKEIRLRIGQGKNKKGSETNPRRQHVLPKRPTRPMPARRASVHLLKGTPCLSARPVGRPGHRPTADKRTTKAPWTLRQRRFLLPSLSSHQALEIAEKQANNGVNSDN